MANNLGIKVKIDFSSIDKLESKLKNLTKEKINIDLNLNTTKAMNKLSAFESNYKNVKKELQKGLDIKINDANVASLLKEMKSSGLKVKETIGSVSDETKRMNAEIEKSDGALSKIVKTSKVLSDGTMQNTKSIEKMLNTFQKESEKTINGNKNITKTTTDRVGALKQIASIHKEIANIQSKSMDTNDGKSLDLYKKRLDGLKDELNDLNQAYKKVFKEDPGNSKIASEAKDSADLLVRLKQVSVEKKEQAKYDKETQGYLDQVVSSMNKYYSLMEKSTTVGQSESNELKRQAELIREKSNQMVKQVDLFSRISAGQVQSLNNLEQQNALAREYSNNLSKAKSDDVARINAQKAAFSELKTQIKEVYSLQEKLAKLSSLEKNGSINGKETDQLYSLRQELKVREDLLRTAKEQASQNGQLSGTQSNALAALEREKAAKLESVNASAKVNAEIRRTSQMYDEIASSVRRVSTLSDQLANAGSAEASIIKRVIALEEQKQAAIQGSISAQGKVNAAREEELSTLKRQNAEIREQNSKRSAARQSDEIGRTAVFGDILNPISVANDVRQAAMTIYDSIQPIDEQMIKIAKVADVPDAALEKFRDNVYDTASSVGKSAEEFGLSVERWLTTGKTLSEATELSKTSVMGSFVGNIDEESMVSYMSVPLNAYKKDLLEATDIINAMNEVSNNNAIEMDDMGAAYKRAAGTSAQAGTSFSELTGIITAAQEATRVGGESIGTAIKGMDVNFGKISSEETAMDKRKYKFFADRGVQIKDQNDQLRSTYDILNDLSGVWESLSDADKSQAGFYAAGKQFSNVFTGIMSNWDTVNKATRESQTEIDRIDKTAGSAFQEFSKQQDSISYKAANLKNSWAEFLNTISGGREGVLEVMAALNDGLQRATELAKNDTIMGIAKGVLKIVAAMTATTMISKFFDVIIRGSVGTLASLSKLLPVMAKVGSFGSGKVAKNAGKSIAVVGTGSAKTSKNVASSVGKLDKVGGMKMAIGGLGSVVAMGGRLIPVVGGLITAFTILDTISGGRIWDATVDGFKAIYKAVNNTKDKLKEYKDDQESATKALDNNMILSGVMEKNNQTIKSYDELKAAKEKAFKETGDKSNLSYSEDEFKNIKSSFNQMAEAMGFDVRITMNNYDDIAKKFEQLKEYKKALSGDEAVDLAENLNKKGSYDTKNIVEQYKKKLKEYNYSREMDDYALSLDSTSNSQADKIRKNIKESNSTQGYNGDFFNSKEMIKAEKENTKRLEEVYKTREKLAASARAGTLQEGFGSMDSKDQKQTIALLSSELPLLKQKSSTYDTIAEKIRNNGDLTLQEQNTLKALNKDYANLSDQTSAWTKQYGEEFTNNVIGNLESASKSVKQNQTDTENSIRQLAAMSGMSEDAANSMIETSQKSGRAFVDMMGEYGDMGASILGLTEGIKAQAESSGMSWQQMAQTIQDKVDAIPDEKVTKYNLVQENGVANFEEINSILKLPEEVTTKFHLVNDDGTINIKNTVEMLDTLPEEVKTKLDVDGDGTVKVSEMQQAWSELSKQDKIELVAQLTGDTTDLDSKTESAKKKAESLNGVTGTATLTAKDEVDAIVEQAKIKAASIKDGDYKAYLKGDGQDVTWTTEQAKVELATFNQAEATGNLKGDSRDLFAKKMEASGLLVQFGTEKGTATIAGNSQPYHTTMAGVDNDLRTGRSTTVKIMGIADGIVNWFRNLGGASKTVSLNVKGNKSNSSVINPQTGSSMSASIGSSIIGKSGSSVISKSTSSSSKKENDARVDEDVWRYWSKELFKGNALDTSMENLKRSIDESKDKQDKLIPLYKKQISLLNEQVSYQKDLKNSQQAEMNEVISKLRGYGFKNNGNQITNLGISKSFKGDKASDASTLLSRYKELYESINKIDGTIKDLQSEQKSIGDTITETLKEGRIDKEAKALENTLKKTNAILTRAENNRSIQTSKEDLLSDSDYELNLGIKEQGMNTAKTEIKSLISEYNRLSLINIEFEENSDDLQSKLDSLKTTILENADAVVQYKEELENIRIDRLINDFDEFSNVLNGNIDRITNNISNIKDGLISGTNLSDLTSSSLDNFDLTRKTKVDSFYQDRLNLEAELNAASEGYAKKYVDRTEKVANSVLTIEKDKYTQLLAMQKSYTNGTSMVSVLNNKKGYDIGTTDAGVDTKYSAWKNSLKQISLDYSEEYRNMVSKYDKAMDSAENKAKKESYTNAMIIDQLKLQQKMYSEMVDLNNQMINSAQTELQNKDLTTDQRNKLLESIKDYEQANIDAQNSIKDTISSRFDLEFDLIDKSLEKTQKYSDSLDYMLNIADLVGVSNADKQTIYDAIYKGKVNEYSKAKQALSDLNAEQEKFAEGSYEWNLLQDKIEDVNDSMKDLVVDTLNANKDSLGNSLTSIQDALEKNLLDGKTMKEWKDYQDHWVDGLSKELKLNDLKRRLLAIEDKTLDKRLEALDGQKAVSQTDLDYLDKQTKVLELQKKLSNLSNERNVQTLVRGDDGQWGWDYLSDQSEYDKTKQDLDEAQVDLDKYIKDQREEYVSGFGDIIDKAKDGKYSNTGEMKTDLDNLQKVYGGILKDIPNMDYSSIDDLMKAYNQYLSANNIIAGSAIGKDSTSQIDTIGSQFETSFKNISGDLGEIIGKELRNALTATTDSSAFSTYNVTIGSLDFPNVTDTTGMEQLFKDLPSIVSQQINSK